MGAFRFIFTAEDYEKSVGFYRDTLGLAVVDSWDDDGLGTILQAAAGQVEIFGDGGHDRVPPSGVRIAWQVDSADEEFAVLRERGVQVAAEPADQPWGHRSFTIVDPDGIHVTLFQVIS